MLKNRTASEIAICTLAAGATVAVSAPASAATVGMRCSSEGHYATGNVNYTNSSTRHNLYSYDWDIHGQSGSTKNNVSVVLHRDKVGPDEWLHGFASGRERNGYGAHAVDLSYPKSYKLYGSFTFVFDINNRDDPRCSKETTRF